MNWFGENKTNKSKSVTNKSVNKTVNKSVNKTIKKTTEKRYHVRTADRKIVVAYNKGNGYEYRIRTPTGIQNVAVRSNLYRTEEEARKRVEELKTKDSTKKIK